MLDKVNDRQGTTPGPKGCAAGRMVVVQETPETPPKRNDKLAETQRRQGEKPQTLSVWPISPRSSLEQQKLENRRALGSKPRSKAAIRQAVKPEKPCDPPQAELDLIAAQVSADPPARSGQEGRGGLHVRTN